MRSGTVWKICCRVCKSPSAWCRQGILNSSGTDYFAQKVEIIFGQNETRVCATLGRTEIMQKSIFSSDIDSELCEWGGVFKEAKHCCLCYKHFLTFSGTQSGFLSSAVHHPANAGLSNGVSVATGAHKWNKLWMGGVKVVLGSEACQRSTVVHS